MAFRGFTNRLSLTDRESECPPWVQPNVARGGGRLNNQARERSAPVGFSSRVGTVSGSEPQDSGLRLVSRRQSHAGSPPTPLPDTLRPPAEHPLTGGSRRPCELAEPEERRCQI